MNLTPDAYNTQVYFKSSANDLCNNNRNYESISAARINQALCIEDGFQCICFRLLLNVALLSSMDSDLEAFSHNPTDGSFTALAGQLTVFTNYLDQLFLSY